MSLQAQEVTPSTPRPYHGPVGDGGKVTDATSVLQFFRLLKAAKPPPMPAVEQTGVRAKVEPEPDPMPAWDQYTYRKRGDLLVQHYVRPHTLKAWCYCGNWCHVTTKQLDEGVTACAECRMEGYLEKSIEISKARRERERRGEE